MEYRNGPSKGTAGIRGKDDDRKLFVGGLPKPCGEKELRETFSKFGTIESINIKRDPATRAPRGFCFIVFSEASVVEQVMALGEVIIGGKRVEPRRVTKMTTPGKIFVGGLTPEFSEETIRDHFGQYGTITEVQWPYDRQKNQKRSYCFITFENRDTVTELLKTPKMEVCGKELDLKKVKFNPETMWQHGGGAAGGYGARGGRGAYIPEYAVNEDYFSAYNGYNGYSGYNGYNGYNDYEAYSDLYATRAPRGGRAPGGYARHTPY